MAGTVHSYCVKELTYMRANLALWIIMRQLMDFFNLYTVVDVDALHRWMIYTDE